MSVIRSEAASKAGFAGINKFRAPGKDLSLQWRAVGKISDRKPSLSETSSSPGRPTVKTRSESYLYSGERLGKADKLFATLGTIEELQAYLGGIKVEFFGERKENTGRMSTTSEKMLMAAKITQIQESLNRVMLSLGTSRQNGVKFEKSRFIIGNDLDAEIQKMQAESALELVRDRPLGVIPGYSTLEAHLFYARSLCRRAERQAYASSNMKLGLLPEESVLEYLDKLGNYLLLLALVPKGPGP